MGKSEEELPLEGIRVLVTRAREQSAGLVHGLTSRGADVRVIPAVSVSPLPETEGFARAMANVGLYENVVFTSVNGVEMTLRLLPGEAMGPWDFPPALCVGEKTASAWEEAGGTVAAVPGRYTAEALLEILGEDLAGQSYLIMRPEVVKTDLGKEMAGRGAEVDEIVLYQTITPEEGEEELRELMAGGGPDVIFFASPSAVEGTLKMAVPSTQPFDQAQGPEPVEGYPVPNILNIPAVCIGPTTAKAAEEAGFTEIYFPDEHTAEGMVEELIVISGKLK